MNTTVNKVELTGYLGAAPTIFNASNGNKITKLRLATSIAYKSLTGEWVESTTWHSIVLWNNQATNAFNELKKGMRVNIQGRIVYKQYMDKEGVSRFTPEIVAYSFKIDMPKIVKSA